MAIEAGFAKLLERVRALLELGREQALALQADDFERYDALLGRREALVAELGVGDEARERSLTAVVARAPEAARAALLGALEELAEIDLRSETVLASHVRVVLDELPQMEASRRAAVAYHSARPPAAYVDASS